MPPRSPPPGLSAHRSSKQGRARRHTADSGLVTPRLLSLRSYNVARKPACRASERDATKSTAAARAPLPPPARAVAPRSALWRDDRRLLSRRSLVRELRLGRENSSERVAQREALCYAERGDRGGGRSSGLRQGGGQLAVRGGSQGESAHSSAAEPLPAHARLAVSGKRAVPPQDADRLHSLRRHKGAAARRRCSLLPSPLDS
jgi:hypothetical protein